MLNLRKPISHTNYHSRRESMIIEIEEDNSSPFAFAELKEMDNEESTEGNQSKRSSTSSAAAL